MELIKAQEYDLRIRHEKSQTVYDISRHNQGRFSIYHSIDEDGCEAWRLMPSKTSLSVPQKIVNLLGEIIEAGDL